MKKLLILLMVIFAIVLGTEPEYYTRSDPPPIVDDEWIIWKIYNPLEWDRVIKAGTHQTGFYSVFHLSDTIEVVDTTGRGVGFKNLAGNMLLEFCGDSVVFPEKSIMNLVEVDSLHVGYLVADVSVFATTDTLVGENCEETVGALVYYADGPGEWLDCDNTVELKCKGLIGFYHGSGKIQIDGIFTTTGLTKGAIYYIGTSGGITSTAPTADNSIERILGRAISSTKLKLDIDPGWMEVLP